MAEGRAYNMKTAYGDESILLSANPPLYLMCASILESEQDRAIDAPEHVKPKGAPKLHWRSMTDSQKASSVAAISAVEHQTTIVTASPLNGTKQERARRKCLESLLVRLEALGVGLLTLESRREPLDGGTGTAYCTRVAQTPLAASNPSPIFHESVTPESVRI